MKLQDQKAFDDKNKEFSNHEESFAQMKQACAEAKEAHAASQKHYHAVTAGLSTNEDGTDASLNDQLMGKFDVEYYDHSICAFHSIP